ncbi:putative origin recognition complex subunit 2-like [Apostichopus japonicus]|uniref:Origin recognition complex subunit 2 n=1 Tax=Stichopus japonicus TaxID=307972 RepID=A0A2G8JLT9_STIJA|nr:putative origin recognition complex subunit 2-like [Apostichopus japonicus]
MAETEMMLMRRGHRIEGEAQDCRSQRYHQDEDSSEDSAGDSSSDEEDTESLTSEASEMSENKGTRRSRRSKVTAATSEDLEASSESYFRAHSGGVVTSDHTLSRLAKPKMDQKELDTILRTAENSNNDEKENLYVEHTRLFHKWMVQLSNGFNLLLYGLGSKRHLMESFRSKHLLDFHHIVINGFFPSLAIRQILSAISEDVLESKVTARGQQEQLELIKSELEKKNEPVFIILHNIDGPILRVTKNQNLLSSLAQISCVHMIASIDHINAPLIWDQGRFCCFNWLWYDVTSYQDYTEETSYENSLLVRQSGALTLSSINHVLKSVPPNVQGVFNILVEAQLEHKDDISYSGMTFQDLYQRCREAFYVSSDLTLRAQLTEFKDHKLLTFKKGIDGAELLSIPVESSTLQEFKQEDM